MAVDSTSIYWTSLTNGQVLKANKDGSSPTVLSTVPYSLPFAMTIDDAGVYWGDNRSDGPIARCAKGGCDSDAAALAPDVTTAFSLALDDKNVYFAEEVVGAIGRVPKTGGTPFFIATNIGNAWAVATDNTSVFFTDGTNIATVPTSTVGVPSDTADAGTFSTLYQAANNALGLVVAADGKIYWTENNETGGAIKSIPKTGASVANVLASNESFPAFVAVDDANVYWTAQGVDSTPTGKYATFLAGYVAMCPKAGCPNSGPIHVADGLHSPNGIAVDDTAIYFTVRGNYTDQASQPTEGSIMKAMK
jgi:hypothetical protein